MNGPFHTLLCEDECEPDCAVLAAKTKPTEPVYDRWGVQVFHGDNLDVLQEMPDASIDSVVTDPPAGVRFMNRAWDSDMGGRHQWVAWLSERMAEAYRVLKPGGHALVWALPRTSHWTAWALEDAGFEVRDCVTHLFGTGFPKSLDIGKALDKAAGVEREITGREPKLVSPRAMTPAGAGAREIDPGIRRDKPATDVGAQWDGWGTALKPASEHWWLCRKPLSGTVAANVVEHGTGALNIDGCRIPNSAPDGKTRERDGEASRTARYAEDSSDWHRTPGPRGGGANGRWPSNVTLFHAVTCTDSECGESCPVAELDAQSGTRQSGTRQSGTYGLMGYMGADTAPMPAIEGSTGGASRFFQCFRWEEKAPASERPRVDGESWPTVKPVDLMRYLIRLVTPPGGTVLDLFAGTGTTGQAARAEGMRAVLIEQDDTAIKLIRARLDARPRTEAPTEPGTTPAPADDHPVDLLDLLGGDVS